ncbi:MAG: TonB-dependent receptor [Bacteroidales bacterium]|nr:TonB-dependent receptor [Bacteroidales bacterium]
MGVNSVISRFLLLIAMLAVFACHGQQAIIRLVDQKTGEPVPYAHVFYESVYNHIQQHGVTNDRGEVINPVENKSVVTITFVGYETLVDTIMPGESKTLDFRPAIFNMGELVVTAQYKPQRVDKSIYKVKVIGASQIEQKAANNLSDLLSDDLSIRINQDGALGSSMSIRGLSGEHVKFLVDGVPVIGRLNGNIDLGQLILNNVDHVEMIEGPMSVVYGSNALAGVVNIITKENKNTPLTATAEAYVESVGTYNFNGGISGKKNNNVFGISGGRNYFEGYDLDKSTRSMTWKPKRQYFADGYYIYDRPGFKFKYSSQFFNELLWNKGNKLEPYFAIDNYFRTNRFNNGLDVSARIGKIRYLKILAAYSIYERVKSTYFKNLHTLEKIITENDGDQDTTKFNSLNFRAELSKSTDESKLNYQFGLDVNVENGTGQKIEDERQSIGDYAAFLSLKYDPIPTFTIQPGVRVIYNTKYAAPLVYSLNVKWNPLEYTTVRASYSRGFRAPSLKELYLFFVDVNHNIRGNENLKAEDSHNVIFTFDYNNEKGKANWGMDFDLFYNSINNIITIAQVEGDLYSYINIDNYTSQGFQVDLFYDLYPQFKWNIGLIETGRKNKSSELPEETEKFYYSTDINSSITYRISGINTSVSVFYKFTGKLPQVFLNSEGTYEEGYIDSYNLMDVTLNKNFLKSSLNVSFGVKNLFDVKTLQASGASIGSVHGGSASTLVGYGTSFFAGISYVFNKFK